MPSIVKGTCGSEVQETRYVLGPDLPWGCRVATGEMLDFTGPQSPSHGWAGTAYLAGWLTPSWICVTCSSRPCTVCVHHRWGTALPCPQGAYILPVMQRQTDKITSRSKENHADNFWTRLGVEGFLEARLCAEVREQPGKGREGLPGKGLEQE